MPLPTLHQRNPNSSSTPFLLKPPPMRLPKKQDDEVGFQLAPMIDMTFLLLVFFMVTTKISKEQIKVDINLPIASNAIIPEDLSNRDIISIDAQGNYFIGQRPASKDEVLAYLKQRFIDFPPLRIYVRADASTPGKKIKEFMRMASEAGAINVIFGTYQK
ncbi:MAG: biopolymer transporter ExbD [Chthoniobacterales bacterium]|nr:biopolymer transporter ExbD [Chthoniobacterales bacterium]